jgi:hypothetical protein
MVSAQARRFQPEQIVQGRATVRNSGNVPAFLGVRVVSGVDEVLGFTPGAAPVVASTPARVQPGETAEVYISVRVPRAPGPTAFQLEVGTLDPTGQISRVLDRQTLRGLAEVLRPDLPPLPIPDPEDLPRPERLAQFRQALGTPNVSASPRDLQPGQTVRIFYQFPGSAPFPLTVRVPMFLLGPAGQQVRTFPSREINVRQGDALAGQIDIDTSGLTAGQSYGIGMSVTDPLTGQNLVAPFQRLNLFSLAEALQGLPSLGSLQQIQVSPPQALPRQVEPGRSINITLPVNIPAPAAQALPTPNLVLELGLLNPQGIPVGTRRMGNLPIGPGSNNLPLSLTVPSGAPAGPYGVAVAIWDRLPAQGGRIFFEETFRNVFSALSGVQVPTVDPTLPTPVGPPPPQPTSARLVAVSASSLTPRTVERGQTLTGTWTVRNSGGQSIRTYLFLEGPAGLRAQGTTLTFESGDSATLRAMAQVPLSTLPGSGAYRLEVRDASTQRLVGDLRQTYSITITREPEPEPAAPPEPADGGFIGGNVSLVATGPMTPSVDAGDTIQIQFTLRNNSNRSGRLDLMAFGQDPGGNTRGTGRGSVNLSPLGTANPRVPISIASGAPSGLYGVRVFVWDQRTFVAGDPSTYLIERTDRGIFQVR